MQRQPRGCNNILRFFNKPHLLHVLFVKVVSGTTFTSWSKHHFVVIGKAEQQVRKPSHCGIKQQWRSHVVLILFLLFHATWVWFITHIPFVVNRTFNTMITERLHHLQNGWARLFEMAECERDKQNVNWENLDINDLQSNLLKQHWNHFQTYLASIHSIMGTFSNLSGAISWCVGRHFKAK